MVWGALRRQGGRDTAGEALSRGDFGAALASGERPGAERRELLAAAMAARHLLLFDRAAVLLDRLSALDADDPFTLLERALGAVWQGEYEAAEDLLARLRAERPQLAEPLALHRAFLAWRRGDADTARRGFEEISAAIESKLGSDIGPGDGLFADWFLEAGVLWRASGDRERAAWAAAGFARSAPQSRLAELLPAAER